MNSGRILVANVNNIPILKFIGDVRVLMSGTLDNYFSTLYSKPILDRMIVDMTETQGIDSTALGLLAKMAIQLRNRFNVVTLLPQGPAASIIPLHQLITRRLGLLLHPLQEQGDDILVTPLQGCSNAVKAQLERTNLN